jgi:hypothetical protein
MVQNPFQTQASAFHRHPYPANHSQPTCHSAHSGAAGSLPLTQTTTRPQLWPVAPSLVLQGYQAEHEERKGTDCNTFTQDCLRTHVQDCLEVSFRHTAFGMPSVQLVPLVPLLLVSLLS